MPLSFVYVIALLDTLLLALVLVRPPGAVTAHGKHQPLQWNIGSVHRYTERLVSQCSITSPSAFR